MSCIRIAVPRKGRPLECVLQEVTTPETAELADEIISTLRYEKAVTKGSKTPEADVYDRLASYSDLTTPHAPEYTLLRDDREGMPRRVVFDSVTIPFDEFDLQLVGREEPLRALRKHEFALGFDSADLILEEVVSLTPDPLTSLAEINERISPLDTDVRVATGLGDTIHHSLLATPEICQSTDLDRSFVAEYEGELCISPRYERLVGAVLGSDALEGIEFTYPEPGIEEEAAIADTGIGVYLTVTGSTARDHGLVLGERLFPSETVLLTNVSELDAETEGVVEQFRERQAETAITAD